MTPARPEWIFPFTGHPPGSAGWSAWSPNAAGTPSPTADRPARVLLVATYRGTNLTMRQIGPLFGVSHSAAHRVIDTLEPLLALAGVRRPPVGRIAIVDGTLSPPDSGG